MQKYVSAIFVTMILVCTGSVLAQEKGPAPEKGTLKSQLLIDNDKYRVNETRAKPGDRNNMQQRPDRIVVHLNAGKQRVTCSDGKTEEREFKAGHVEFHKADTCQAVNIGSTETRNLVISAK